jgi:AraC family transcriptional regulator of adaptative response/methylated-DNA-[protein]-cysteine methyltransferase
MTKARSDPAERAPPTPILSTAAFRDLLLKSTQLAPERIHPEGAFHASWIDTPLGPLIAVSSAAGLHILEFPERRALPRELSRLLGATGRVALAGAEVADQAAHALELYFTGQDPNFHVKIAPQGTDFERAHWKALQAIPAGETRSYAALAETLKRPGAHRAVGRANGANPLAILVPCHRLVASDGSLTGYGGGLWRKRWLIDHEAKQFGRQS